MQAAIPTKPVKFKGWSTKARTARPKGPEQWKQAHLTLTLCEAEIVVRRAAGLSYKHIARELDCSEGNSKQILRKLLWKHDAANTAELVSTLISKGILSRDVLMSISAIAVGHLAVACQSGVMTASSILCSLKPFDDQ